MCKIISCLVVCWLISFTFALGQINLPKRIITISLGETPVKINIYERRGSPLTFFAPHHNEQTSAVVAKELIAKRGGRLIEVESVNEEGKPLRRLRFAVKDKSYSVDPNRIFTDNGRACDENSAEAAAQIKIFADKLLKIILPAGKLRKGEKFVVALHNNRNIDGADLEQAEKERDLTAFTFVKGGTAQFPLLGAYQAQAAGVFLSNSEPDEDNFFFLSKPTYLNYFARKGFHVVLQKAAAELKDKNCEIDDGSLSVYFGQRNLEYINVEADSDTGKTRQGEMITTIYQLLKS